MNFTMRPSAARESTLFTREEVIDSGCCFTIFAQQPDHHNHMSMPPRNRSESKIKKIDLVIAKRGHTQEKDIRQAVTESLKVKPFNGVQIKQREGVSGHSSQTSKTTTQKNSLKSSKIKLCPQGKTSKLTLTDRYQRYISINNQGLNRPIQITFNQTRSDSSNLQFLSEISMVEEEFISYESTTWRALNILPSQQIEASKRYQQSVTPVKYMMDFSLEKQPNKGIQTLNPLQRLLQKKRGPKPEHSKLKLVL